MIPWYIRLIDYYPTLRTLSTEDDTARWEKEIDRLFGEGRQPSNEELSDAVALAAKTGAMLEHQAYNPPTPRDVVRWVRDLRDSRRPQRQSVGGDGYTKDPVILAEVGRVIRGWLTEHPAHGSPVEIGESYRRLDEGAVLSPEDEFWNGRAWVRFGANANDTEGRPRRLVQYRATIVRRAVPANVVGQPRSESGECTSMRVVRGQRAVDEWRTKED